MYIYKGRGSNTHYFLARSCVGVEMYADPLEKCQINAKKIHETLKPCKEGCDILYSHRMDSPVKYGVLAICAAEIFVWLLKKSCA